MSSSHLHHLLKSDSISFSVFLLIAFLIQRSTTNPAPAFLPPLPSPEALQQLQEELPSPSSLKNTQNSFVEKNICEAVIGRIFFCNCDSYERPVDVTCFATSNSSSYMHPDWLDFSTQSALLSSSVTNFKLTAFNGNAFSYLPVSAINHLRPSLIKLTVSDLRIGTLATNSISNFAEMEEVDFQLCRNMTLEERPFSSLPKLRKVIISEANIGTLKRLFEAAPSLKEVYISKSNIREIQVQGEGGVEGAFIGMESCQYLDLEQNAIQKVSQATFKGLRSLKELQLNRNSIHHLPAGTFAEMPHLTEIELNHNQIESVDPSAFAGLPRLQSLKMEHNRLREFPAAGVFSTNRQLTVVDIAFNYFDSVSWTVFYQPTASGRYIRFRIQGNAIKCTCSIAWMRKALKFYDSIVEQELHTMDCIYPEGGDQQQHPFGAIEPNSRPKSIYAFITSPEVASNCKLPSALIQAEEAEEEQRKRKGSENKDPDEADDDDDDNEAEDKKRIFNEVTGNEIIGGEINNGIPQSPTTPKMTRIYENGSEGENGVYQSPHSGSNNKAPPNSKENTLNQAQFGAGSAAPTRTALSVIVLIFAVFPLLYTTVFSSCAL